MFGKGFFVAFWVVFVVIFIVIVCYWIFLGSLAYKALNSNCQPAVVSNLSQDGKTTTYSVGCK
jgi:hypothetical protein